MSTASEKADLASQVLSLFSAENSPAENAAHAASDKS